MMMYHCKPIGGHHGNYSQIGGLSEKCPNVNFFWSSFSRNDTVCRDLHIFGRTFLHSIQKQEIKIR